jgi:hypothetical protein
MHCHLTSNTTTQTATCSPGQRHCVEHLARMGSGCMEGNPGPGEARRITAKQHFHRVEAIRRTPAARGQCTPGEQGGREAQTARTSKKERKTGGEVRYDTRKFSTLHVPERGSSRRPRRAGEPAAVARERSVPFCFSDKSAVWLPEQTV